MNNAEYMRLLKAQRERAKMKESEVVEALKNAEYMRLLKAQRERAKMKESEVVEAHKIEEPEPAPEPEPEPEPIQEPDKEVLTSSYGMEGADNGEVQS